MAPITRLALVAMLAYSALVSAVPVVIPNGPSPALVTAPDNTLASGNLRKRGTAGAATVITRCTVPGTVAITFDDGPYIFTSTLLDTLKAKNVKVTFFMNGDNYEKILDNKALVQRAHNDGHQIASHTWDHKDLATLSKTQVTQEMTKLEAAFKTILGKVPTFMRPPYGSVNAQALSVLGGLGYKVITWDEDTEDWQHPTDVATSLNLYKNVLGKAGENKKAGHIFLEHDVIQSTALTLAPAAIDFAISKGFKVVPVGTCLGVPESKWYK
ncbi:hypothetical protein EDD11_002859 [Mortierella claussenii]|nr:hypothetical protein EDD11_002859 [Mortierella claussenii]